MTRFTLILPDDVASRLKDRAAESGHPNPEDYVEALIRADLEVDEEHEVDGPRHLSVGSRQELEAKLVEGLESPASEITAADWAEMRRRFAERQAGRGGR